MMLHGYCLIAAGLRRQFETPGHGSCCWFAADVPPILRNLMLRQAALGCGSSPAAVAPRGLLPQEQVQWQGTAGHETLLQVMAPGEKTWVSEVHPWTAAASQPGA